MAFYPQLILDALKHVRYPGTGEDIVSAGMVDERVQDIFDAADQIMYEDKMRMKG